MSQTDDLFFSENVIRVNKMFSKFLLTLILVPVFFLIFDFLKIFNIPTTHVLIILSATIIINLVSLLLIRNPKAQIATMYYEAFASNLMIFLIAINPNIQVSLAFALCPIITCLYYNAKLTRNITIFSYLVMVFSMYIKSFDIVSILNYKGRVTPMSWYIPEIAGMSIQYIFVCTIAFLLTKRTQGTFRHLMTSFDERNSMLNYLQDNNEKISELNTSLQTKNEELIDTQFKTIKFVAEVLGSHDLFTGRHVRHTQKYVEIIAKKMQEMGLYTEELTERNIDLYSSAAFLHDIGKVHVPEGILNKVGKFTPEEFERMKCHTIEGKKLLEFLPPIENGEFNQIASQMAYYHHEKWNGKGYPTGLSGTKIPLCARIMAAADVMDALISQRLYKDPMTMDQAIKIFEESRGSHFEPCIVDAVIQCRQQIEEEDKKFKEEESITNAQELEWWQNYHSSSAS